MSQMEQDDPEQTYSPQHGSLLVQGQGNLALDPGHVMGQGQLDEVQGQPVMGMSRLQPEQAGGLYTNRLSPEPAHLQQYPTSGGMIMVPGAQPTSYVPSMVAVSQPGFSPQEAMLVSQGQGHIAAPQGAVLHQGFQAGIPFPMMQQVGLQQYPAQGLVPLPPQQLPVQQQVACPAAVAHFPPAPASMSPHAGMEVSLINQTAVMDSPCQNAAFHGPTVNGAVSQPCAVAMVPPQTIPSSSGHNVNFHTLPPGWITAQLRQCNHPPPDTILQPANSVMEFQDSSALPYYTRAGVETRPSFLPQHYCMRRANPVEARFRALYPSGFPPQRNVPRLMCGGGAAAAPIRHVVPASFFTGGGGQCGRRSTRFVSGDGARSDLSSQRFSQMSVSGQVPMDITHGPTPMEVDPMQATCLVDVHIRSAGGQPLRAVAAQFVERNYRELGQRTYCVPHKTAVREQHADKALVRTREGEFRVSMALEQLSVHTDENLFILGDYHYESFLHHLSNLAVVHPAHLQVVRETLAPLRKEPQFGDFDLLVFHPHCGVIVVGLCSVNSNSDVQYILKRIQKARMQLSKSVTVAQQCVAALGIKCAVMRILCTPNLKRSFLAKVTARDKQTDRALSSIPVLCNDQLPVQFRLQWQSAKLFKVLCDWWTSTKAKWGQQVTAGLSQEQFTLLVGCFLCPSLSKVEFDQSSPYAPSEKREVIADTGRDTSLPREGAGGREQKETPQTPFDVSTLSLSIGNVTKSFSQYMAEYVELYFPNFMTQTYRVPPIHFNIQKIEKKDNYDLLEMPMSKDTRGDEGENRVVGAIEMLGMKYDVVRPVFIICDFQYNNYLNKLKESMFVKGDDRRPKRAYGQAVRAQHDCLLIHRRYGIIIISVKAVGDNFEEWANDGNDQWNAVKRTLTKVLKQLPREEAMVTMVLSDLTSDLPFTKLIALPNLCRQDVNTAVSDDPQLKQDIEDMFPGQGTEAFLCKDELCETKENIWEMLETDPGFFPRLCGWWDRVVGKGRQGVLSEHLYKQIIGRFCGLLSSVEVWSVHSPRVEVRSHAEAIQETAERYSRLVLTPQQVSVLQVKERKVYLSGPPGTGKTLMLVLQGHRWAREGQQVVVLNLHHGSPGLPLGHLLHTQIEKMLDPANPSHHHPVNRDGVGGHVSKSNNPSPTHSARSTPSPHQSPLSVPPPSVSVMRVDLDVMDFSPMDPGRLLDIPEGAYIIADEVKKTFHAVLQWVETNRDPQAMWCAGQFEESCPPDFPCRTLNRVLRCPPMVQRVLQQTSHELGSAGEEARGESLRQYDDSYVPSSAPHGLATDGSRPWLVFHSQHASPARLPLDCAHCGHDLATLLQRVLCLQSSTYDQAKRQKLGPLPITGGEKLSMGDIVITSSEADPSCALITALRNAGIPVVVVKDTNDPSLAFSNKEAVTFTTTFAMTGLERKVVIYVPFEARDPLEGGGGGERVGGGVMDDLKVGQAVKEMTGEDRVRLWYAASRCISQLIIVVP